MNNNNDDDNTNNNSNNDSGWDVLIKIGSYFSADNYGKTSNRSPRLVLETWFLLETRRLLQESQANATVSAR